MWELDPTDVLRSEYSRVAAHQKQDEFNSSWGRGHQCLTELSSGRGETADCGRAPKEREPVLTSSTSLPGSFHGPLQPLQSTRVAAQAVAGIAAAHSLESTPDRNSMSPGSLTISLQHYHFTGCSRQLSSSREPVSTQLGGWKSDAVPNKRRAWAPIVVPLFRRAIPDPERRESAPYEKPSATHSGLPALIPGNARPDADIQSTLETLCAASASPAGGSRLPEITIVGPRRTRNYPGTGLRQGLSGTTLDREAQTDCYLCETKNVVVSGLFPSLSWAR